MLLLGIVRFVRIVLSYTDRTGGQPFYFYLLLTVFMNQREEGAQNQQDSQCDDKYIELRLGYGAGYQGDKRRRG